jgi:acetyl esterase/lipase
MGYRVWNCEYKLAPEHKLPAGLWDCFDAVLYCKKSLGVDQVILSGISSGGGISTVLTGLIRDGLDPDLQPVRDLNVLPKVRFYGI